MWEHQVPKEPELERDHLRKAKAAIEKLTGKRPIGTRSWHTPRAAARGGLYLQLARHARSPAALRQRARRLQAVAQPAVPLRHRRRDVLQLRLAQHENQAQRMMDPDHVEEIWWAAFLQQYQQGGYLNICMHPFVSGRALRIAMLDRLIGRMKACPASGSRPARRWRATCSPPHPARRRPAMPWKERYTICDERTLRTPTCAGPTASAAASASSSTSRRRAGPKASGRGPHHARRLFRHAWRLARALRAP